MAAGLCAKPMRRSCKVAVVAAEPVAETQPEPPRQLRIHTVQRGDNLDRISKRYYGKSTLWPQIQKANADLLDGSVALYPGMQLVIPDAP